MKETLFQLIFLFFFQLSSLCQDTATFPLKKALQGAIDDSTRLSLHIALTRFGNEQEKLLHAETAVKLGESLLKKLTGKKERKPFVLQQIRAYKRLDTLLAETGKWNVTIGLGHVGRLLQLNTELGDKKGVANQQFYLANYKLLKNDTTGYLDLVRQSLASSLEAKDSAGIIGIYHNLSYFHLSTGNFPKALETLHSGLAIAREMNYKQGLAELLRLLADIYRDNNEAAQALQYYHGALPILYELKDTAALFNCLSALGGFYYKQGNTAKAIDTYQKAIALAQTQKDLKDKVPLVYKWMGQVYKDAKDYSTSLYYYEKSLEGYKKLKSILGQQWFIGDVLSGLGGVYQELGDFQKAADYYLQALKLYKRLNFASELVFAYLGVARARLYQKNLPLAKQYSHEALQLAKKQYALDPISQAEQLASQVDSASGNGLEALGHYKEYVRLSNQLRGDEIRKAAQVERFDAEFAQQKALARAEGEKREALAKAELKQERTKRNALMGGVVLLVVFGGFMFNRFRVTRRQKQIIEKQKAIVEKEKQRSDDLLLNILPAEVAEELKEKGRTEAKLYDQVTVMFTDFKDFTTTAEKLSPKELVAEIDTCFKAFDHIISQYNIEKIKTIGDSYMCVGGLPVANRTNAVDVVKAAIEIQRYMERQYEERKKQGGITFEIRIGIHTGAVVAGIVGVKKFAYDVWGDTVNIASRMESSGETGKVNISGETYKNVKEAFSCYHRGKIKAKNKGEVDMYFVEEPLSGEVTHLMTDGLAKIGQANMD